MFKKTKVEKVEKSLPVLPDQPTAAQLEDTLRALIEYLK